VPFPSENATALASRLSRTPFACRSSKYPTIGVPSGGATYVCKDEMKPGEYDISPADENHLPEQCKRLK
jgi:hypothetical protein